MSIGLFGGTFDPIHNGHLSLALDLMETTGLKKVLFIPAFRSPFKEAVASSHHRLAMVRLAIAPFPHFEVSDWEILQGGVSYTIDTVRHFSSFGPCRLLLSEESAALFFSWKEPLELIRLAPPLIGYRGEKRLDHPSLQTGLTPTRLLDISSTEIRERLKKNLPIAHLLPNKALDYIQTHRVY
jgi:nicotinate-nucleotide adenylyltransferase